MSRLRVAALCVLALLLVVAAAAVFPLPRRVTRWLAAATAPWLVTGPADDDGRVTSVSKRLLFAYVQMSLAAHIAAQLGDAPSEGERLQRIMDFVRARVVNQEALGIVRRRPAFLGGAGYADQVNGAVAMVAARHFEKAQVYALAEMPHAIGRVWSAQRKDWIYFDASADVPMMFTTSIAGKVVGEMKPTFGAYIFHRTRSADPPAVAAAPRAHVDDAAFHRVARDFVLARVDDLLGPKPVETYRRIAADPGARADDRVAELALIAGRLAAINE